MKRKYIYFTAFILLCLGAVLFLFRPMNMTSDHTDSVKNVDNQASLSPEELETLHPLANLNKQEAYREQTVVSSWEEYLDTTTEHILGTLVQWGNCKTLEEVESQRKVTRAALVRKIAKYRKTHPPPKHPNAFIPELHPKSDGSYSYSGQQTSVALISEFDAKYFEKHPEAIELDEHFPKEVFLQKFLDKGYHVNEYSDYADILGLRRQLIKFKDVPAAWRSGDLNIPITTNFEEYVDGYIDRKVWELNIIKKVSNENPEVSVVSIFFPPSHPDKFLPSVGKMTYIRQKPSGSMRMWGSRLSSEQRSNLLYKGIEPEGIEIVYIDDDYNVVEKPAPFDRDKWREENSYDIVPEGLRDPDGTIVPPERYEQISGVPMSYEIRKKYDEAESPIEHEAARRETARAAAEAAEAAAKAAYEKFAGRMRQLESFSTMSDAEIEKQLERQFRKQFLPEHPIEQLEQITPERLERALGTLFQHGFEDGMRMIRKDNATLADQLERHFGKRVKPPAQELKPPQKPVPPKPPSEPPVKSDETQ